MNDDLQTYIEPELEARLVALVLGEASAFEAEELERLMSERVELKACKERLEKVHGVLGSAHEAGDDEAWKLSSERRGKIFAKVEEDRLEREKANQEKKGRRMERMMGRRQLVLACAACVVVGLMVLVMMELGEVKNGRHEMTLADADMTTRSIEPDPSMKLARNESAGLEKNGRVTFLLYGEEARPEVKGESTNPFDEALEGGSRELQNALAELNDAVPGALDIRGVRDRATTGNLRTFDSSVNSAEPVGGAVSDPFSADSRESEKDGAVMDHLAMHLEEKPKQVSATTKRVERRGNYLRWSEKADEYRWSGDKDSGSFQKEDEAIEGIFGLEKGESTPVKGKPIETKVNRKPSGPSSAAARGIAAATTTPEPLPVPKLVIPASDSAFGDGNNFGDGWGEGGGVASGEKKGRRESGAYVLRSKQGNQSSRERGTRNEKEREWYFDIEEPSKNAPKKSILGDNDQSFYSALNREVLTTPDNRNAELSSGQRMSGDQSKLKEGRAEEAQEEAGYSERLRRIAETKVRKGIALNKKSEEQVPLLGDLPETGRLFGDDVKRDVGKEASNGKGQKSHDFLGGGTVGSDSESVNRDFIPPVDRVTIPGIPASPAQEVSGIITGGNRSGSAAIDGAEVSREKRIGQSDSQLKNVRDGGVKKNLSAFLHGGEMEGVDEDAIGISPSDALLPDSGGEAGRGSDRNGPGSFVAGKDGGKDARRFKHSEQVNKGVPLELAQTAGDLVEDEKINWKRMHRAGEFLEKEEKLDGPPEQQEIIRRQQNAIRSDEIRNEGVKAYANGDYEMANRKYREALSQLPPGTATEDRREYLNQVLQDSSIALTQQYRRRGQYEEARELLKEVEGNDPGNVEVAKNLEYLDDPLRSNPSLTEEHSDKVDQVRRNLYKGEGYYDLGLYDKANEEFKEVLRADPYNKAARRWMERTAAIKSSYYRAAYDQTRAEMLMEVDRAWELAVPKQDVDKDGVSDQVGFLFGENVDKELKSEVVLSQMGRVTPDVENAELTNEEPEKEKESRVEAEKQKRMERASFETSTTEKSDSTFSLNVSDVSFKLAKASLANGKRPEVATVRAEEFVNALDYDDRRPTQAEKVACEFEQGTHPFMSQRNLMRISMSAASLGRNAGTPLRLTLLLDQSGSMERADRVESLKRAFALLAAQLNANDEVTLIGFARTPRLLAERVKGNEVAKLAEIIANPLTEGGTNLEEALASGLQLAKQQFVKDAQNRIILLTDGAANLGDARPERLAAQVEAMREVGISFDACGVGADGLNDEILSSLAKKGDGRYYFLDRPEDADEGFARQIAGALRPAAKNVKVQVLFNPERVTTFKLYGFEKHKLKKEDFRNDSVDAAEMAAEESGVALYHFEPNPEGRGDVGTVSVRFLDTASNEMVERTWIIPYEPGVAFFKDGDPRLRLAGVAGLFAEKLKGSPVGERVELKKLRQELEVLKPEFGSQTRFRELQTMLRQAGD